jgi:uncharacterized membrane protein YdbT with pleckstrin-like domain
MSYIAESLSDGEKIEAEFALHWTAWVPVVICVLIGPITFGILWLVAVYLALQIRYTEQGLTNKRVILKRGIIGRHTDEMKLTSIETVEIDQGIWGRLLNFGTIHVTGRGISDVIFKGVADPMAVKRRIESVSNPVS